MNKRQKKKKTINRLKSLGMKTTSGSYFRKMMSFRATGNFTKPCIQHPVVDPSLLLYGPGKSYLLIPNSKSKEVLVESVPPSFSCRAFKGTFEYPDNVIHLKTYDPVPTPGNVKLGDTYE